MLRLPAEPVGACFVSQPSLSEQLRRLEAGLGVALFVRTNHGLVLVSGYLAR